MKLPYHEEAAEIDNQIPDIKILSNINQTLVEIIALEKTQL